VAVKKFLDQDFSGDALTQFKSEVTPNHLTIDILFSVKITCNNVNHIRNVFIYSDRLK
jgi:hypothetical protein